MGVVECSLEVREHAKKELTCLVRFAARRAGDARIDVVDGSSVCTLAAEDGGSVGRGYAVVLWVFCIRSMRCCNELDRD